MNLFAVMGSVLAVWALVVSFLGIRSDNFPGSKKTERAVALITAVLVLAAIGSAVFTGLEEESEKQASAGQSAVLTPEG